MGAKGQTNELRWDGRVAVITGGGRNLGRAYAHLLAARGARVLVNDLGVAISDTDGEGVAPEQDLASAVVQEILSAGGEAVANNDSVATEAGGEAIIAQALDAFGRVDIVINNAGVVRQAPFAGYDDERLVPVIESQIGGHFHVTRPAWPVMQSQGYGRVLNLTSGAGLWGVAEMTGYSAAKMAIVGFTRALAQEGSAHGITVNVVAPCAKTRPGGFGPIPASAALNEWLSIDAVAPVVAWLVHEDCVITGECFTVGGGYVGRVSVAINDGHRWERPLTPESVSSNWDQIMQDDNWRPLPLGRGDLDRVLKGFNP
ncbi:MAG: SDR family NAD(P)-dependent oxidoreductase [Acidimicrobiia bacterium]|nr:SDR family NAD(P)-dependent oxidoreductase [Acidimicrobiia bacterium]